MPLIAIGPRQIDFSQSMSFQVTVGSNCVAMCCATVSASTTRAHGAPCAGTVGAAGRGVGGNLVSDAHLSALAIEHGAEPGTFDRDFQRFAGLRMVLLK
jgi:hypothetical protein